MRRSLSTTAPASPDPEKMGADEFTVRWEGSVIAEETGIYEFIVKTRERRPALGE